MVTPLTNKEELLPLCKCGCGLIVTKPGNRFIHGHNRKDVVVSDTTKKKMSVTRLGVPRKPLSPEHCDTISKGMMGHSVSPETRDAISTAKTDVPHSLEHCAAISKGKLGIPHSSETQIVADKAQRGGNDIVKHHYIYDHNDLSKYTIKMTRSKHIYIHNLMRKK